MDEIFRVRLNCVDHYQHPPSSLDPPLWGAGALRSTQRNDLPNVPIVRVFGATETGQKVCAHIHGAFPYLFVAYNESLEKEHVEQYISDFRQSADHALALSYRRNPYAEPRNSQFVAHISLVKGVPFFGYNVGYKHYLKIYMLNPLNMTRFSDLLLQGAILQRPFQPYEGHLQYLLQWMCDFNLYGCAYIETTKPHFRVPVPLEEELDEITHLWHSKSINAKQMLDEDEYPRQSHCQLELDLRVEDILNRHSVKSRELHYSFIERLSSLENLPPEEKLVHSMAGLWKDETRRRKMRMGLTDPGSSPFPAEVLVSMSADPRNDSKGGWIHEKEFRTMVDGLAKQEKKARGGSDIRFETFLPSSPEQDGVQTILESVEELFQDHLVAKQAARLTSSSDEGPDKSMLPGMGSFKSESAPLVDMASIAQVSEDDDYGRDEDVARTKALTQRQKLEDANIDGALGDAKVHGDAEHIERRAEQFSGADVPEETVRDVQMGSLKRSGPVASQGPFKRVKFDDAESKEPAPRRVTFRVKDLNLGHPERKFAPHWEDTRSSRMARPLSSSAENAFEAIPSGQPPPSSQRSSQSQGSQNSRLDFAVSKNRSMMDKQSQREMSSKSKQRFSESSNEANLTSLLTPSSASLTDKLRAAGATINSRLLDNYAMCFPPSNRTDVFVFSALPPTRAQLEATIMPSVIYQDAYYSNERDVPEKSRGVRWAGL